MNIGRIVNLVLPALALSYLGSGTLLRFGANFYPEAALLPWLIFHASSPSSKVGAFVRSRVMRQSSWLLVAGLILLATLGALHPGASLLGIYANARSLLVAVIAIQAAAYAVRTGDAQEYLQQLLTLCLLAAGFSLLQQLFLSSGTGAKSPIPLAAPIIALAIAASTGRYAAAMLALLIVLVAAATGFFRQYVVLAALSVVYYLAMHFPLGLVPDAARNPRLVLRTRPLLALLAVAAIAVIVLPIAAPMIAGYLGSSDSRYVQAIGKWSDFAALVERGVLLGSEQMRAGVLAHFATDWEAYLLPNGLWDDDLTAISSLWGGSGYYAYGISPTRDSILVYAIVTFGILGTVLLAAIGAALLLRVVISRPSWPMLATVSLLAATFGVLLLLDGTAMIQLEKSFFTGTLIALLTVRGLLTRRAAPEPAPPLAPEPQLPEA